MATRRLHKTSCSCSDSVFKLEELSKLDNEQQTVCHVIYYRDLIIEDLVDKGQFGSVFRGYWRSYSVAIKELENLEDCSSFVSEVNIMSMLNHENIVKFIGACNTPVYCILMEFVDGGSLYKALYVYKTPFTMEMVTSLLINLCQGLSYLHGEDVLHRDLKSKNVLLTANSPQVAKLCDFGVSRFYKKSINAPQQMGSLLWMAPEVMKSENFDYKADIYSLGVIIYELLCRVLPFSEKGDLNLYNFMYFICIQGNKVQLPSVIQENTPSHLSYSLERCVEHSPELRPSANELIGLLRYGNDTSNLEESPVWD